MAKFLLRIISPADDIFSGEADMVIMPGEEGDLGILKDHAKMIVNLKPGIIRIHHEGSVENYFVAGGIAQINSDEIRTDIISDFAILVNDLNKQDIESKIQLLESSKALDISRAHLMLLDQEILRYSELLNFL